MSATPVGMRHKHVGVLINNQHDDDEVKRSKCIDVMLCLPNQAYMDSMYSPSSDYYIQRRKG